MYYRCYYSCTTSKKHMLMFSARNIAISIYHLLDSSPRDPFALNIYENRPDAPNPFLPRQPLIF